MKQRDPEYARICGLLIPAPVEMEEIPGCDFNLSESVSPLASVSSAAESETMACEDLRTSTLEVPSSMTISFN